MKNDVMRKDICEIRNGCEFESFHPAVSFIYFSAVIAFSMVFMHPVCLIISAACATAYSIILKGRKAVFFNLFFLIPVILTTAFINPAFNHEGVTIITYLPSGNPLTAESVFYGIAAGTMLASVICWFSCFNVVMTSDKFVWLFGRITPALSLVLAMSLRFVPRFKSQLLKVCESQRNIGRDISDGGIIKRGKCAVTILSIMVTWALENAIETADSMKSRGYGSGKRTSFSIYRLGKRDKITLCFMAILIVYILVSLKFGGMYFRYFPSVRQNPPGLYGVSAFAAYFALCIMPVIIECTEARKWK